MKALFNDGSVAEVEGDEALHVIRHSAAHIMAQAIKRLYPEADFAYGPATDNGFYYDVDLGDKTLSEDDLPAIEAEMKKIVKENLKFQVFELPREEAIALMEERGEKYKVEHIGDCLLYTSTPGRLCPQTELCSRSLISSGRPSPRADLHSKPFISSDRACPQQLASFCASTFMLATRSTPVPKRSLITTSPMCTGAVTLVWRISRMALR